MHKQNVEVIINQPNDFKMENTTNWVVVSPKSGLSNAGGGVWAYYKTITIDNSGGAETNNYQVKLTIDTATLVSAGKLQVDCDDLRFLDSDNSTELSYYLESGANSASTIVWVKIPTLTTSASYAIYMYYGNSSATSSSSGTNVFSFFDDFLGTDINATYWYEKDTNGSYSVADSILTVVGGSGTWEQIHGQNAYKTAVPAIWEINSKTNTEGNYWYVGIDNNSAPLTDQVDVNFDSSKRYRYVNTSSEIDTRTSTLTNYTVISIYANGSNRTEIFENYVSKSTDSSKFPEADMAFAFQANSNTIYIDWCRTRVYQAVEPTNLIGAETEISGASNLETSTTKIEGTYSLSFDKTQTASTGCYVSNYSLSNLNLNALKNYWGINGWVYLSSTDVSKVASIDFYLGSDTNLTSNYVYYRTNGNNLSAGWNFIGSDLDTETGSAGTINWSSVDSFRIHLNTNNTSDTLTDVLIDNFHIGAQIFGEINKYSYAWSVRSTAKREIGEAEIEVIKPIFDKYPELTPGNKIKIYLNDIKRFDGYIEKTEEEVLGKIYCKNLIYDLLKRKANTTYLNQTISAIVEDLIDNYSSLLSTYITSTTTTLSRFTVKEEYLFDVIKRLSDTLKWQFYCDVDGNFYFEPIGTTDSGKTFQVGVNCVKLGKWTFDKEKLKNYITIEGDKRNFKTTEWFTADGAGSEYALNYYPETFTTFKVGSPTGSELIGGIVNTTSGAQYYVDKESKKVITTSVYPTGSKFTCEYDYLYSNKVDVYDYNSINNYGRHDYPIQEKALKTRDDCLQYGKKMLEKYKEPFINGTLTVATDDVLTAGQMVTVIDSQAGINESMKILNVVLKYPNYVQEVTVGTDETTGNEYIVDFDERIKSLEKQSSGESQFITNNTQFDETFKVYLNQTLFKIQTRELSETTCFILDNYPRNVLDQNTFILDGTTGSWVTIVNDTTG